MNKIEFTNSNLIKVVGNVILIILVCSLYNLATNFKKNKVETPQFKVVQVDLVKISSDYMQKAILLVAKVNDNAQLTPDQKMAKSQSIMKIVGNSLDSLLNDYSASHQVVILQKQMIASDMGYPIADITTEIESQIDSRISPEALHNAAIQ